MSARGTRSQTSGLGRVWRRSCENHRSLGKFSAMLESQACGPVEKKMGMLDLETTQLKTPQACCKLSVLPACCNLSTNFSISSSCNKSVKIRLVTTCRLQTCYNLLKQLAASLWITSFDNQLATSLLGLFIKSVTRCQQTNVAPCAFLAVLKCIEWTLSEFLKTRKLQVCLSTSRYQDAFAWLAIAC